MPIWVARTPAEQARGLSELYFLSETDGMLFAFERPTLAPFWNRGTYASLDIAFLDENGVIRSIHPIRPIFACETEEMTWPENNRPYSYALEMPRGWFRRHGLSPGSRVDVHQILAYSRPRP